MADQRDYTDPKPESLVLQLKTEIRDFPIGDNGERFESYPAEVLKISDKLIDILLETELPQEKFPIVGITSTTNDSALDKLESLQEVVPIKDQLFPHEYPEDLSFLKRSDEKVKEVLKINPGVNMVHAWMKVLNMVNGFIPLQKSSVGLDNPQTRKIIVDIVPTMALQLYAFTTEGSGESYLRSNRNFKDGVPYPETTLRALGVESLNPQRHVCYGEMAYILDTVKTAYTKE